MDADSSRGVKPKGRYGTKSRNPYVRVSVTLVF